MLELTDKIDFTSIFNVRYKKIYLIIWIFGVTVSVFSLFTNFYLTFLSLAILVIVSAMFIKPIFGFYLLLFTLIEEQVSLIVMSPPFVTTKYLLHLIFLFPTFIGWLIAKSADLIDKRPYNSLDTLVIIVVTYQTISILWAPSFEVSLLTLIMLYSNFLLYYLPGALVRDQKTLKNCVNLWIITGVIVGIGVLLTDNDFIHIGTTTMFNNDIGLQCTFKWHNDRASGFAGSDSASGFMILASAFAIGAMFVAKGRKKKLLFLATIIFMFYCTIVSKTRSSMFGHIFLFLMFLFIDPSYRKKFIRYSIFTLIVAVVVILLSRPGMIDRTLIGFGVIDSPILYEKEITKEETLANVSGLGIRMIWWKDALKVMLAEPWQFIIGLGISGFVYHTTSPCVNGLLWAFFFDMGIFGIILLMFFLISVYNTFKPYLSQVNYKRIEYTSIVLVSAILGFIADSGTHGLVDYDITGPGSRLVWFPLGFIVAILNIVKDRELEDKNI
jgi:hypothetical protein